MTASVLIINSNNICLGSDSNVTIDNVKTFTGVKKLHCLCDELPMAIMNYGNAEFAFIDFETIVGEFKKRNEINKLSSVKNIVKNFIEFLKEFTDSEDCDEFIEYYLNEFKKELIILIQEMDEIDFLEFLKNIETKNLLNFLNGYTIDFSEIVPNYMVDFEYVNLKLLHAFSTYLEDNSVGVVIAGFDKEFNRPSFVNFNLFFNNNGKIEWKCNYLEENYDGVSILTFAQDDEIKAFIEGIDKYFENELINYWRDMINILFNDLFESISKNNSFNEDLINVL